MTPGWTPGDPIVRALRAVAVVAFLTFLGIIVLDPSRREPYLALGLLGSILFGLGFPIALRIPGWTSKPEPKDEEDE